MVVVGNNGSARRRRWAARRLANGCRRRSISPLTSAMRCRTAGLWMRGDLRRLSTTLRLADSSAATADGPRWIASVRTATSSIFCLAKAIQLLSSSSSDNSCSRSIGQCSSEQEGATMMLSGPIFAAALSKSPIARSKSACHTFRPSTTPSESVIPCGIKSNARSNCSGARTRSRCTAATGNFNVAGRLSARSPK